MVDIQKSAKYLIFQLLGTCKENLKIASYDIKKKVILLEIKMSFNFKAASGLDAANNWSLYSHDLTRITYEKS